MFLFFYVFNKSDLGVNLFVHCRPATHGSASLPRPLSVLRLRRGAVLSAVPALRRYGPWGAFQHRQLCTSNLHDRTHHRAQGTTAASTILNTVFSLQACRESPHSSCFLQPGDFVHTLGDAHVYVNHVEPLKVQVG